MRYIPAFIAIGILFSLPASAQPKVNPDNTVTFRYKNDRAKSVAVDVQFAGAHEMVKGSDGVWTVTLGPAAPDIYPYCFKVDGVSVMDPENPEFFPNEGFKNSLLDIRGNGEPLVHALTNVPHGAVDYVDYYSGLVRESGADVEVIFSNRPTTILQYTDTVIACDIHTRTRTKRILKDAGAKVVLGLDDILRKSVDGSGFNEQYGLLGSNKATEDTVKLFPRECRNLVLDIQASLLQHTGKHIEVMVYGDGAFKDPKGEIWELADPVVSPAFTDGLNGTPNELKLKYLADNDFADLSGEQLKEAISRRIKAKDGNLKGQMASQGTTPRQLTDLIGSLCDLTSGSGDKGTPIVLVQGYFDNYTSEYYE